LTPAPTGTPFIRPTPTGLFTLAGHVAEGPRCDGDRGGTSVTISPGEHAVLTGADGRFEFPDLPHGFYTLRFFPECPVIPCYGRPGVFLADRDVEIDVCRDHCPAATQLTITSGTPGSLLDLTGRCDAARNAAVTIWFDDRPLATLQADADGVYHGLLTIPPAVDYTFQILEADDSNNVLEAVLAAPTACDVIRPPCTPTPPPTETPEGPTPTPT
jgi:hypothetical protein